MSDAPYSLRQYGVCLEASERDMLAGVRRFDRDVRQAQREDMRPLDAIAPTLIRYWSDQAFAAQLDAETEQRRAEAHAARQAVVRAKWEALWAREDTRHD